MMNGQRAEREREREKERKREAVLFLGILNGGGTGEWKRNSGVI